MNQPIEDETPEEERPVGYDEVRVEIADPTEERPTNLDDDDVAHFCVIPPKGSDFCGGCGDAWPCEKAVRLAAAELPTVQ